MVVGTGAHTVVGTAGGGCQEGSCVLLCVSDGVGVGVGVADGSVRTQKQRCMTH